MLMPITALPWARFSVPRRDGNVLSYLPFVTMMFLHIHGGGRYIYINVSEIHSGNCVKISLQRVRRISFKSFSHPS